jgi:hypothetical protein
MIFWSICDFVRVLLAFAFVFVALPLLGAGWGWWSGKRAQTEPGQWIPTIARAFLCASVAAEVGCVILGELRLCLPGIVICACVAWCVGGAWIAHKNASRSGEDGWLGIWKFVAFLDKKHPSEVSQQEDNVHQVCLRPSQKTKLLVGVFCLAVGTAVRIPLQQAHFDHEPTYIRTVSLATLTQGQSWKADGSVALLAPLVSISGLNAASVIRFSGPIFVAVFLLLIAFCMWQIWRHWIATLITALFFIGLFLSPATAKWDLLPESIAMVYWVAASAIWHNSGKYALLAAVTALMIAPGQWLGALMFGLVVAAGFWNNARLSRRVFAPLASLLLWSVVLQWHRDKAPRTIFQYESAARTCEAIGREFHHNEWLVISPFQELVCTYGQGWHVELTDFVSKFTPDQVSRANFQFPYRTPHVFIFVERRPLPVGAYAARLGAWRYAPAESDEWSSFLYSDPLGRASLEYRAAELLNAYAHSHKDLSLFYEDDDLVVYHLAPTPTGS